MLIKSSKEKEGGTMTDTKCTQCERVMPEAGWYSVDHSRFLVDRLFCCFGCMKVWVNAQREGEPK
jgi:hypothetical protein